MNRKRLLNKTNMNTYCSALCIGIFGAALMISAAVMQPAQETTPVTPQIPLSLMAESHTYAGVTRTLHAPKIDEVYDMQRIYNINIPAEQAEFGVQSKERSIVEIKGVINKKSVLIQGEITEHVPVPVDLSDIPCNVPNGEPGCKSAAKTHMSYRAITSKNSPQYALQQKAVTDTESKIRMVDGCYLIAVGTYYADHIGQRICVTMSSGLQVMCMVGEFKSDYHTDPTHRYHVGGWERGVYYEGDGSVIEFIVDRDYSPDNIPDVFDGKIHNISQVS